MQSHEGEKKNKTVRHVRSLKVVFYSWNEGCPL